MRSMSGVSDLGANGGGGKSAVEQFSAVKSAAALTTDGKSAADDGDWFAEMARALHPDKPGTIFHYITGYDERLCQRYAPRRAPAAVRPSAYFLRKLLRSKGGWTYLACLMDGSEAPWWLELQQAVRVFAALKQVK